MPLIRIIQIKEDAKIGIWELSEPESYFRETVSLQKSITHPHKRLQHLAGRRLLQELESDFPVNDIRLSASGKPYLQPTVFEFSISHSENHAVAIVSTKKQVGIDVEKISPKLRRVAPKFLSEKEQGQMPDNLQTYALCWSAKEAVYKWYGEKGLEFKKHLHLTPFQPADKGVITCEFQNMQFDQQLQLSYLKNEKFVLVWVVDDKNEDE